MKQKKENSTKCRNKAPSSNSIARSADYKQFLNNLATLLELHCEPDRARVGQVYAEVRNQYSLTDVRLLAERANLDCSHPLFALVELAHCDCCDEPYFHLHPFCNAPFLKVPPQLFVGAEVCLHYSIFSDEYLVCAGARVYKANSVSDVQGGIKASELEGEIVFVDAKGPAPVQVGDSFSFNRYEIGALPRSLRTKFEEHLGDHPERELRKEKKIIV